MGGSLAAVGGDFFGWPLFVYLWRVYSGPCLFMWLTTPAMILLSNVCPAKPRGSWVLEHGFDPLSSAPCFALWVDSLVVPRAACLALTGGFVVVSPSTRL